MRNFWPLRVGLLALIAGSQKEVHGCSYIGPSPAGLWLRSFYYESQQSLRTTSDPHLLQAQFTYDSDEESGFPMLAEGVSLTATIDLTTGLVTRGPLPDGVTVSQVAWTHTGPRDNGYDLVVSEEGMASLTHEGDGLNITFALQKDPDLRILGALFFVSDRNNKAYILYSTNNQGDRRIAMVDLTETEDVQFSPFDFGGTPHRYSEEERLAAVPISVYDDIQVATVSGVPNSCTTPVTYFFYDTFPPTKFDGSGSPIAALTNNTGNDPQAITAYRVSQSTREVGEAGLDEFHLGSVVVDSFEIEEFVVLTGEAVRSVNLDTCQIYRELLGMDPPPVVANCTTATTTTTPMEETAVPGTTAIPTGTPVAASPTLPPMVVGTPVPTTGAPAAVPSPTAAPGTLASPTGDVTAAETAPPSTQTPSTATGTDSSSNTTTDANNETMAAPPAQKSTTTTTTTSSFATSRRSVGASFLLLLLTTTATTPLWHCLLLVY